MIRELLTDPIIVFSVVFVLGAAMLVCFITATTTRRWHDRHHQSRSELMCDHCRARHESLGPNAAPPFRVLGDPRR